MNYQLALEQVNRQIEKKRDEISLLTTIRASLQLSIQQTERPAAPAPVATKPKRGELSKLAARRTRIATTMLATAGKAQLGQIAHECNSPPKSILKLLTRLPQFQVDHDGYWSVVESKAPETTRNDDDDRVRIHDLLGERGATKLVDISIALKMPVARVTALLSHEWFQRTGEGFAIA